MLRNNEAPVIARTGMNLDNEKNQSDWVWTWIFLQGKTSTVKYNFFAHSKLLSISILFVVVTLACAISYRAETTSVANLVQAAR